MAIGDRWHTPRAIVFYCSVVAAAVKGRCALPLDSPRANALVQLSRAAGFWGCFLFLGVGAGRIRAPAARSGGESEGLAGEGRTEPHPHQPSIGPLAESFLGELLLRLYFANNFASHGISIR